MIFKLIALIRYYFRAGTKYNVQSPFLHDFVINVLDQDKTYYAYLRLEGERDQLLKDETVLEVEDYGAGSQSTKSSLRSVKSIAATAVSRVEKCRLIFQLIDHYRCQASLELGTSLGLSSAYMAWANLSGRVTTMEGSTQIAQYAANLHKKIGINNTTIIKGPFDQTLPALLSSHSNYDFIFLDGHHDEKATIAYFETILNHTSPNAILVIDDIYWSEGMENAWNYIQQHSKSRLCLDLFEVGIVFLDENLSKEQMTYIPYKFKPWRIGLFGK